MYQIKIYITLPKVKLIKKLISNFRGGDLYALKKFVCRFTVANLHLQSMSSLHLKTSYFTACTHTHTHTHIHTHTQTLRKRAHHILGINYA